MLPGRKLVESSADENRIRPYALSAQAQSLLKRFYLRPDANEHAFEDLLQNVARTISRGDATLADKLYAYSARGYFAYASPILSNCLNGARGLPISCFLMHVPDDISGIIEHTSELRWLSVLGGGCGGHWSALRGAGVKSCGVIPFLHTVDADMTAYRQGATRKGSYAAYLDVNHPDIMEFIGMRTPTGDDNRKNLNLHHGVNVTDDFMKAVEDDAGWTLSDAKTGRVCESLSARALWNRLLETRFRTGEPYLNFIDAAQRHLHPALKARNLKIHGSNLCNEIHLPTDDTRTAVCCLSSLNLEKFDEWKCTDVVETCVTMLDNVLSIFIERAQSLIDAAHAENKPAPRLEKAVRSATAERSLGLGALGWARYLQACHLPYESDEALRLTDEIFKLIKRRALNQTQRLAKERGEPSDLIGYGVRNAHLLAVAPNANSASIVNTSPSTEPQAGNAYVHRTRAGSHLITNPYLQQTLKRYLRDDPAVWDSIVAHQGSVAHLSFLSARERAVFKTAFEMDQSAVVKQAAVRQRHICQGQSLNLFFPRGTERTYLNRVHLAAWKWGCKGLYYVRTTAGRSSEQMFTTSTKVKPVSNEECVVCQG